MARLLFFRSHRDEQIPEALDEVADTVAGWIFTPSVEKMARMLRDKIEAQGGSISLEESRKHARHYKPGWRR